MLRDEILKNEEEEVANAHERLVKPTDDKNDEEKLVEKLVDKELEKKELSDDEKSEESEKIAEKHEEEQAEKQNQPNDDLNGSTVEIVQPTDLKPKHLGCTRTLLLAMFAAMIGTGAQFGYALGVMNAPSEVNIFENILSINLKNILGNQKLYKSNLFKTL